MNLMFFTISISDVTLKTMSFFLIKSHKGEDIVAVILNAYINVL